MVSRSAWAAFTALAIGWHLNTLFSAEILFLSSSTLVASPMNELWSPTTVSSQPSQQNTNNSTIHRFSRNQPTVHASHYNQILRELHEMSGQDKANLTCPPPLQLFHNKLVWQNAHDYKDDESTIPRILHVSHKSRCLAPDFVGNLEIWAEQLPRFSIIFYDDEAVERIFGHATAVATFPLLNHIRQCALYKGAMKIDIWRILIVYIYGGFYTDMDNTPSENFREELFITPNVSAFSLSDYFTRPSQFLFAMEPGHPAAYYTLENIQENLIAMPDIITPQTVYVTGPHAFYNGFRRFMYGDETKQPEVVPNPPILDDPTLYEYVGIQGKVWRRNKRLKGRKHMYPNQRYLSHHWFGEYVDFQGSNVTRKERARLHTKVNHWKKQIEHVKRRVGRDAHRSCEDYLRMMEEDPSFTPKTH